MKLDVNSIELYLQTKDYIDTALIPLIEINMDKADVKQSTLKSHWTVHLSKYIEEQLTGRIMLLPAYPYVKSEQMVEVQTANLNHYAKYIKNEFKHVIFVMENIVYWQGLNEELYSLQIQGEIMQLEQFDEDKIPSIGQDLMKQIIEIWKKG